MFNLNLFSYFILTKTLDKTRNSVSISCLSCSYVLSILLVTSLKYWEMSYLLIKRPRGISSVFSVPCHLTIPSPLYLFRFSLSNRVFDSPNATKPSLTFQLKVVKSQKTCIISNGCITHYLYFSYILFSLL